VPRLSKEKVNAERWNEKFIEKTIQDGKPQKMWVCGPPAMSEVFERYLYNLQGSKALSLEMEIL
jgi:predicted ferric reductase